MRSKKFKFLIALLLVIALAFSLVACVNDKDNDDDEDVALTVTQLIDEMSKMLQSNLTINNPRNMNIDIVGDASLSESADNNRLWRYEAIVKANIGLGASSKEQDTNLRLELNSYTKNDEGVDVKTTLFALLYESEVNANGEYTGSYFYLVLPGSSTPLKINGVALLKLIAGADEAVDKIDISTYFALVANLIFETGEKTDNGYKFTIDMFKVWEIVSEILGDTDQLSSLIGTDVAPIISEIDKIIPEIFGNLTYKGDIQDDPATPDINESATNVDIAVKSLAGLISYVDQNMPSIKADVLFKFNKSNFAGATIDAVYQERNAEGSYNAPTHKFNMNISKLYIGIGNTVAYDENFIMDAATRKAMAPTGNLLTFSIDGKMFLDEMEFNISLDSNLNPLLLLDGFDFGKLDTLGYFNLEITKADGTAVLTLQLNPTMKAIIVSYASPGKVIMLGSNIFIGGIFNYQALGEYINILSGATATQTVADTVADTEEAGQDLVGKILNGFLSRIDVSNLATNGFVINNINTLVDDIFGMIDLGLGNFNDTVVSIVKQAVFASAKTLRLTVNEGGFRYGTYKETDLADIDMASMRNNDVKAMLNPAPDDKGKQTMSTDCIQTKYELGEAFKVNYTAGSGEASNTFTVKGNDFYGTKTTFPAVYYGNTYNPNVSGWQKVKVYFGLNSKLTDILNRLESLAPGVIPSNYPLYGIYCMEVDVEVYAPVQSENALLIINGSTGMLAGENIADMLNATLRYRDDWNNVREVQVTSDMISCNKPVIADGKFMYLGKYTITVNYKGIKLTQLITVSELQINGMPSKLEIGKGLFELAEFKLREYNDKGEIVSSQPEGLKILGVYPKYGTQENIKDSIFDEDGILIPNWDNKSKDMYIDIGYQVSGAERIKRIGMSGFNFESRKLFGLDTSSVTLAINSALESTKSLDYKISVKEPNADGKDVTVTYYLTFDSSTKKYIAQKTVKVDGVDTKVELALPYSVKIVKVGTWNAKSNKFDTMATPVEYNVATSGTKLPIGKYNFVTECNGVFANKPVSVYPPFYLNSGTLDENGNLYKNETTITQILKVNVDTSTFADANMPVGNKKIEFRFDATSKTWKICYSTKGADGYVEVDKSIIDYTLKIEMKSGEDWIAPTFSSTGSFNYSKPAGSTVYVYVPYKIDFSMTFEGTTYTFKQEVNIF